jgi:glyoxylase-like metal-dependent hydrolase (beta-lactamase superfamily II)
MRVHHLDCGCMCPLGGRMFDGRSRGLLAHVVCHCLLVESEAGLVLVDTGFGPEDFRHPDERLTRFFVEMNNIQFDRRHTAIGAVERLGFRASDVRHIVLTHLDFDHAGGLSDFPDATVHLTVEERRTASTADGFIDGKRYRPRQWEDVDDWRAYEADGEPWFGFPAVRGLDGLPPEILMIALPGHTMGHAGIAVDTGDGWLLHAGDAYFHHDEVHGPERRCPPGFRAYQNLMNQDRRLRLANQDRLRALANDRAAGVRIVCSHDPGELPGATPRPA